jgi:hypothetical protein
MQHVLFICHCLDTDDLAYNDFLRNVVAYAFSQCAHFQYWTTKEQTNTVTHPASNTQGTEFSLLA